MKYIYILFLFVLILFFQNTCGVEDSTIFFQEPRNLSYDEANFTLRFDGYNQEEDGDEYLFIGYDVYYYFNKDSKNAKKAAVRIPKISEPRENPAGVNIHSTLLDYRSVSIESSFSNYSDDDKNTIYQDVTFPVTEEMIEDVLRKSKSDNVRLCFDNTLTIPFGDENPKKVGNDYILLEELFPKYDEYKSKIEAGQWGNINDYKGFLDIDYYNYNDCSIYQTVGTDNYYKMKVFIIAKGFNSNTERNKGNYIESLKSTVKEITIEVSQSTLNP